MRPRRARLAALESPRPLTQQFVRGEARGAVGVAAGSALQGHAAEVEVPISRAAPACCGVLLPARMRAVPHACMPHKAAAACRSALHSAYPYPSP
eukprot:355658-Chlamydomonas_euryale.AAC.9